MLSNFIHMCSASVSTFLFVTIQNSVPTVILLETLMQYLDHEHTVLFSGKFCCYWYSSYTQTLFNAAEGLPHWKRNNTW